MKYKKRRIGRIDHLLQEKVAKDRSNIRREGEEG